VVDGTPRGRYGREPGRDGDRNSAPSRSASRSRP